MDGKKGLAGEVGNRSLADKAFVALRDHVGLNLFCGVDGNTYKDQQ
tara:strand:+ start:431 stop:568 length:138 start_codon:yes stop_codon:yes gene_type:complete